MENEGKSSPRAPDAVICLHCMRPSPDVRKCPHCGERPLDVSHIQPFLKPGALLDKKYIVGRALGRGGFGATYIGLHKALRLRVAIKELYPYSLIVGRKSDNSLLLRGDTETRTAFARSLEAFRDEGRRLVQLNHANIVRAFDYFEENGTGYLVMEYVDGMPLNEIVDNEYAAGKRFDEQAGLQFILRVLDALVCVHEAGFLHRDVKPSNILLTHDGRIVLVDFGAARQVAGKATHSLDVFLTHGYAPPEQYGRTSKMQGPWSDVYSCAATLFCIYTGQHPPGAPERESGHGNEDLRKLFHQLRPDIGPAVANAMCAALALRHEERPRSAKVFRQILRDTGRQPPITSQVEIPPPQQPRELPNSGGQTHDDAPVSTPPPGNRISMKGGAMLALIATVVGVLWLFKSESSPPKPASEPTVESASKWVNATPSKPGPPAQEPLASSQQKDATTSAPNAPTKTDETKQASPQIPSVSQGYLQVSVNVPDAQVYVNDKLMGRAYPTAPLVLRDVKSGGIEVRAEAAGYILQTVNATIEPDTWTKLQLQLEKRAFPVITIGEQERAIIAKHFAEYKAAIPQGKDVVNVIAELAPEHAALWYNAAEAGDDKAMTLVSSVFHAGIGVKSDEQQAMMWRRRAARAGNTTAMVGLASAYERGDNGATPDLGRAFTWRLKAAELGDSVAMFQTAGHYRNGNGVPKDMEKAIAWYKKSAENLDGNAPINAYHFLGDLYKGGEGVAKNEKEAFQWYRKAAEGQHPTAILELIRIYFEGAGTPASEDKAFAWATRGANQGIGGAMLYLGLFYERGYGASKDLAKALEWYRSAANSNAGNEIVDFANTKLRELKGGQ